MSNEAVIALLKLRNKELEAEIEALKGEVDKVNGFRERIRHKHLSKSNECSVAISVIESQRTEIDQLRAELEKAKGVNDEILGMGNTYSLLHVLEQLCVATDHLLNQHDCDHHGHEGYSHCLKVGWTYIASLQDALVGKYREPDRLTLATSLLRRYRDDGIDADLWNAINEFLKGEK